MSRRVDRAGLLQFLAVSPTPGVQLAFRRELDSLVLIRVASETRQDGRLVELRLVFDPRSGRRERIERYEHDAAGRVMRILGERRRDDRVVIYSYEVERDDAGALVLIRSRDEGDEAKIVYRRSDPSEVQAARRRVGSTLVARVPEWARRVAPEEPVGCIAVIYSVDDPALPPALALATARELEQSSGRSPAEHYAPSEFSVFEAEPEELREDGFREDFRVLDQEWRSREAEDEPRRLLVSVAKRLNATDWTTLFEPAAEFVVLAVDDELADLERNLKAVRR